MPKPHTKPSWLPLRLIFLGAAAGCGVLAWRHVPTAEWLRFLAGLSVVGADGTTLATAMGGRIGTSLVIMLAAMLMAVTTACALTFASLRIGLGLPWLLALLGRLLSALPVVAIGWTAVGVIVGDKGWPIESLLPHHPAPGRDTWELALGRRVWWCLVPCWVLALPLTGELVSRTHECFRRLRKSPLTAALRARGVGPSAIHYHHSLRIAWPDLLGAMQSLGLLAFGYLVFVEEALGIPGWGAFFASALKTGDARGIAGSVYVAGWMSAVWCLCVSLLRRMGLHRGPAAGFRQKAKPNASSPLATTVPLALLVLTCCSFAGPGGWPDMISPFASPLVHDLHQTAAACGLALAIVLVFGALPAALGGPPFSLRVMETIAWSPSLVWSLAISALIADADSGWIALGIVTGPGGAVLICNRWRELQSSRVIEGSLAVGTSRLRAWSMHVMPEVFRLVLAWALETGAVVFVWLALIESLRGVAAPGSAASLGQAIGVAKENVLSDLPPLLVPACIVAICALFFRQLSLIVRPGPPPH